MSNRNITIDFRVSYREVQSIDFPGSLIDVLGREKFLEIGREVLAGLLAGALTARDDQIEKERLEAEKAAEATQTDEVTV